ncbi:MAG: replicative DNA helicase [Nitrospinota bacterium]
MIPNGKPTRLPPRNIEAEQAILGAILLENDALPKCLEIIKDETPFYKNAHKKIFSAILDLFEKNQPIDLLTLNEQLTRKGQVTEGGGPEFLYSLVESVPSAANIQYHAKIVKEKYVLRKMITSAGEIFNQCYGDIADVDELMDFAEKTIFDISEDRIAPAFSSVREVARESMKRIESLYERKELITGIPTGFTDLDQMTAGFQPSDLIIVAGRPSMGKTAVSINMAQYCVCVSKKVVAIFSLEMSKEQLVTRMLCSEGRINAGKLRTGYISKSDWPDLTRAVGVLSEAKLFIDDTPGQSVLEIRAKARRLHADKGLDLIVIDYLQLMQGRGRIESRQQEISEISRSLKGLAKELNVPVIALSQLSRATEQRGGEKRPQLSDLRESGAIEQDADVVMFVYRGEFYEETPENKGKAELIIGKQRNGPIGTVSLAFLKEYTRFENLSTLSETGG